MLCIDQLFERTFHQALIIASTAQPDHFFGRIRYDGDYFDEAQLLEDTKEETEAMLKHIKAVETGAGISAIQENLGAYREQMRGRLGLRKI